MPPPPNAGRQSTEHVLLLLFVLFFSNKIAQIRTIMTQTSNPTPPALPASTRCWVVTNGLAGFEMQAIGVAEALALKPILKRVNPGAPYSWMAPWGPAAPDSQIAPPWPDLLIAGGRQAIPYARSIRRLSGGKTFTVVFQDPKVNPAQFDLVWAPEHDQLSGPNVHTTLTAPNRITRQGLVSGATRLGSRYAHLPERKIAVVIGGANRVYDLSASKMEEIARDLRALAERENIGLIITTSRRTGAETTAVLRRILKGVPHDIYDPLTEPADENPYPAMLGVSEATIVTCDSHNMVGEATTTGRPVYVIELEGGSAKFRRFIDTLYVNNIARQFDGLLERWSYIPLNATQEIASAIARSYELRLKT